MSYTFKGKLISAEEPRTGEGQKGAWASRKFVVEEQGSEYPQKGVFTLFKSGEYVDYATSKFPAVGSEVEVEFNLKLIEGKSKKTGKEYTIQDLSVWKLNVLGQAPQGSEFDEDDNDLPFS